MEESEMERGASRLVVSKCPAECRTELNHLAKRIDRLRDMEKTQWEEIDKRVKLPLFLWVIGGALTILLSLLALIYNQTSDTHSEVVDLMIQTERMETKIEHNTDMLRDESNNRHRSRASGSRSRVNPDGG